MANKKTYLGEFEHLVLLSVLCLAKEAYGVTIRRHLKDTIGREVSIGALYATVERLEKKGYITSQKGEATAARGGKAKRYFQLTSQGLAAVAETKEKLELMWARLPEITAMSLA